MEFLKIVKRRSFLNEVVYVSLNVGLAVALMVLVRVTGSIWPSFLLVILSMWRVFAVRPQFWFANIQANLVSAIVSFGYVVLLYSISISSASDSQALILQIILAILNSCWLLFIKPKSKRSLVVFQAAVALFVGITAIYTVSYNWIATPVVALVWIVGYSTARQVLSSYSEETHIILLSLAWGFLMAEIGWLAFHWTVAYPLPIINNVLVPQVSLIALCVGFIAYKSYDSYYHYQKVRINDIILPLVFSVGIISVLVLALNSVITSAI